MGKAAVIAAQVKSVGDFLQETVPQRLKPSSHRAFRPD
jgi:hypothetical protein